MYREGAVRAPHIVLNFSYDNLQHALPILDFSIVAPIF